MARLHVWETDWAAQNAGVFPQFPTCPSSRIDEMRQNDANNGWAQVFSPCHQVCWVLQRRCYSQLVSPNCIRLFRCSKGRCTLPHDAGLHISNAVKIIA